MLLALFLLSIKVQIDETKIHSNGVTFVCRTSKIYTVSEDYIFDVSGRKIRMNVGSVGIEAKNVSGEIFERYFEAESIKIVPGEVRIEGLCISICGMSCPERGVFTNVIIREERIYAEDPKVKLFGLRAPLFLVSDKYDIIGRSPGFMNPTLSLSKRSGMIAEVEYSFPLRTFDTAFMASYYQRQRMFLLGLKGESLKNNISAGIRYANQNVFSGNYEIILYGKRYHLSSAGNVYTEEFLKNIPASVDLSAIPFSSVQKEGGIAFGRFSVSDQINVFIEPKGYQSFSKIFLSYGRDPFPREGYFFSAGDVIFLSDGNLESFPLVKFLYSIGDVGIGGRLMLSGKSLNRIGSVDDVFLPYEAYRFLLTEDITYPFLFSSHYSRYLRSDFISSHIYLSIGLLGRELPPERLKLIREGGISLIYGLGELFVSVGMLGNEIFLDSGLRLHLKDHDLEFRSSKRADKFIANLSSVQNIHFGFFTAENLLSLVFSNYQYIFGIGTADEWELFVNDSVRLNLSSFGGFRFGAILQHVRPVQVNTEAYLNISHICSEISFGLIYNFVRKDPRFFSSIKMNL